MADSCFAKWWLACSDSRYSKLNDPDRNWGQKNLIRTSVTSNVGLFEFDWFGLRCVFPDDVALRQMFNQVQPFAAQSCVFWAELYMLVPLVNEMNEGGAFFSKPCCLSKHGLISGLDSTMSEVELTLKCCASIQYLKLIAILKQTKNKLRIYRFHVYLWFGVMSST